MYGLKIQFLHVRKWDSRAKTFVQTMTHKHTHSSTALRLAGNYPLHTLPAFKTSLQTYDFTKPYPFLSSHKRLIYNILKKLGSKIRIC